MGSGAGGGVTPLLDPRLVAALGVDPAGDAIVDELACVVVRVDLVERRYRDAIKAGAEPIEAPRDEVGLGAWRRVARLRDRATDREITIWSDR